MNAYVNENQQVAGQPVVALRTALDALGRSLAGRVVLQGDPDWDATRHRGTWPSIRPRWPWWRSPTPRTSAAPSAGRSTTSARSPRSLSGTAPSDSLDGVLLLRTRALNSIEIDLRRGHSSSWRRSEIGRVAGRARRHRSDLPRWEQPRSDRRRRDHRGRDELVRPTHGLAANAIISVDLVDGLGRARHCHEKRRSRPVLGAARRRRRLRHHHRHRGPADPGSASLRRAAVLADGTDARRAAELPRRHCVCARRAVAVVFQLPVPPPPRSPNRSVARPSPLSPRPIWVLTPSRTAAGAATRGPRAGVGHDGPGPLSDLGQITAEPLDPMPATDHSMFLDDLSDELIDQLTRAVGAGSGSPLTAVRSAISAVRLRTANLGTEPPAILMSPTSCLPWA